MAVRLGTWLGGDIVEIEYLLNRFSLSSGNPGITWQQATGIELNHRLLLPAIWYYRLWARTQSMVKLVHSMNGTDLS